MVVIQPHHQALWLKANKLTVPSKVNKPPSYGAWHRQRNGKRELIVEPVEPDADLPKLEGLGAE